MKKLSYFLLLSNAFVYTYDFVRINFNNKSIYGTLSHSLTQSFVKENKENL